MARYHSIKFVRPDWMPEVRRRTDGRVEEVKWSRAVSCTNSGAGRNHAGEFGEFDRACCRAAGLQNVWLGWLRSCVCGRPRAFGEPEGAPRGPWLRTRYRQSAL